MKGGEKVGDQIVKNLAILRIGCSCCCFANFRRAVRVIPVRPAQMGAAKKNTRMRTARRERQESNEPTSWQNRKLVRCIDVRRGSTGGAHHESLHHTGEADKCYVQVSPIHPQFLHSNRSSYRYLRPRLSRSWHLQVRRELS